MPRTGTPSASWRGARARCDRQPPFHHHHQQQLSRTRPALQLNSLDIEADGIGFVTGGEDRLVKLWHYDEGYLLGVGEGHSAGINDVVVAPNKKFIVSVGAEGSVMMWTMPPLGGDGDELKAKGAGAE